jgi:hypothetical protein
MPLTIDPHLSPWRVTRKRLVQALLWRVFEYSLSFGARTRIKDVESGHVRRKCISREDTVVKESVEQLLRVKPPLRRAFGMVVV